jgi:hypothetical protein
MTKIPAELRAEILSLGDQGLTHLAIGRRVGLCRRSIGFWLSVERAKRRDREAALRDRLDLSLHDYARHLELIR